MANHLPLKLLGETEDSYDFEWDDDALIAHVQVGIPWLSDLLLRPCISIIALCNILQEF